MSAVKQMDRKNIRDLVLEIYYDYQEHHLDRNEVTKYIAQDKKIEFSIIDSAFKYLIEANLLKIVDGAGNVKITHLGIEHAEESSMASVDDLSKNFTYIEKQFMGDHITNGDNSTIINRSSINNVNNSFDETVIIKELFIQIENLLKELENRNPNATEQQQVNYIDASIQPALKERCLGLGVSVMNTYIEEFVLENPLYKWSKVLKAALSGWQNG